MLQGLDRVGWAHYSHAHGTAEDVPLLIRALASRDREIRKAALYGLYTSIWHHGIVYEVTAEAVPFLIELLRATWVQDKHEILALLAHLATAHGGPGAEASADTDGPLAHDDARETLLLDGPETAGLWARASGRAVRQGIGVYQALLKDEDPLVRTAAAQLLAHCKRHPTPGVARSPVAPARRAKEPARTPLHTAAHLALALLAAVLFSTVFPGLPHGGSSFWRGVWSSLGIGAPSPRSGSARQWRPPDGQGLYELCRPDQGGAYCLRRLQQIAAGGFQLVLNYDQLYASAAQEHAYAQAAHRLGLRIIWNLSDPAFWNGTNLLTHYHALAATCGCTDNPGFLRYVVRLARGLPGTWGYYLGDEVPIGMHVQVQAVAAVVHQMDPTHPRLLVAGGEALNSAATLAAYADSAEVLAMDIYPVGIPTRPLDDAARYARATQKVADQTGRRAAIVLQAYSRGEYPSEAWVCAPFPACAPFPTRAQMRTLISQALRASRPQLVLWFSYFDIVRSDDPAGHWADLIAAAGTS